MKPITDAQEDQVIGALKKAVDLVDSGSTPNAAIEKIARENGWGRHMVRFSSQAYNTGRQAHQRTNHDSALSKMAEFPLADPDKVIDAIWPSKVKTAAELQLLEVSAEYSEGPNFIRDRYQAEAMNRLRSFSVKEASASSLEPQPEQPTSAIKLFNKKADLGRAVSEGRRQYTQHLDKLKDLAGAVGSFFRQSPIGRMKFAEYELCAKAQIPGCDVFVDHVHSFYKVAESRAVDTTFAEYDEDALPYQWTRQAMKLAKDVNAAEVELGLLQKQASAVEAELQKRASWLGGAAIGGGIAATKGMLENALGSEATESKIQSELQSLSDPAHENELRAIKAQAMLTELMDDDVIGGYPQDQVLNTYNEISQLAPSTSTQPLAMRALLRKNLESDAEPFEAAEIADVGRKIAPEGGAANIMSKGAHAIL